jgi:hypothetical protein
MFFEEGCDKGSFSDQNIPEETVKGLLLVPILLHCYLFNPLLQHLVVVDPQRHRTVSEPVPADFLWLQLIGCLLLVKRVQQVGDVHAGEGFSFQHRAFAENQRHLRKRINNFVIVDVVFYG